MPGALSESLASRRLVGVSLFLVVTACWVLGLAAWEQGWVEVSEVLFLAGAGASAVSLVLTGYLGCTKDALWLGWIPGTTMMAVGFAMTPTPGGDETGGSLVFFGGLVLIGWPIYFFPLIALGVWLRHRLVAMA